MQMHRDAAGRLHIDDEGVSAIVDDRGESSFSMMASASRTAVKRVCDIVEDSTLWPTMKLPCLDVPVDPGDPVPG